MKIYSKTDSFMLFIYDKRLFNQFDMHDFAKNFIFSIFEMKKSVIILVLLISFITYRCLVTYNITNDMIHPELRPFGIVIRIFWPSFNGFKLKLCNFFIRRIGRIIFWTKYAVYKNVYIDREDGSKLRLCVYYPKNRKINVPGLLWIHGGGYAITMPEQDSHYIDDFVSKFGCVVVSPDYRSSTESPYPSALDDCYLAILWMKNHTQEYNIRSDQFFVGGESAGGGLTIALSLLARDKKEVSIAFQMPIFPMMDDRMITNSSQNNDAPVWNTKSNIAAWKLYLGDLYETDSVPKYAAPAREVNYSNLPPALTYVGSIDPFYDETIQYINNLKSEGIETFIKTYEGCFHGFDIFPFISMTKDANKFLIDGFRYAVNNYFKEQPVKNYTVV